MPGNANYRLAFSDSTSLLRLTVQFWNKDLSPRTSMFRALFKRHCYPGDIVFSRIFPLNFPSWVFSTSRLTGNADVHGEFGYSDAELKEFM